MNLQRVITCFTVELVGTAATIDQIIASTTANQIVSQPAINDVIIIRAQRSHLRPDEFGRPFSSVCEEESLNSGVARLLQAFGQPILQPNRVLSFSEYEKDIAPLTQNLEILNPQPNTKN